MAVGLYLDHHVPRAVEIGLRLREVDVLTAFQDDAQRADDAALLDRAGEVGRVLFTQDDDLLAEAAHRQRNGIPFAGVVYAHQLQATIGAIIADLEVLAKTCSPDDLRNRVEFLPL